MAEAFSARQAIVADYPAEVLLRFDEILSETDAQSPCYLEKLKSALFALIIAYMRMIGSVSFLPMVDKTKRVDSRIAEIEKYVRAHMSEQVTLEDIAQHIHISTKQIGRILQRDFCLFRARLYRPVEM